MSINPITCPKFTVSEETARLIDCLNTMQTLYSQVYNALENIYNYQTCEELMNTQFYEEFNALEKRIQCFLNMSIKEKIGACKTEI